MSTTTKRAGRSTLFTFSLRPTGTRALLIALCLYQTAAMASAAPAAELTADMVALAGAGTNTSRNAVTGKLASDATPPNLALPVILQLLLSESVGSLTIKLAAPTMMGDGSAITGLAGFKVYGSRTRQDLNPILLATIADPSSGGTTINGLASGTWYLSATAYTPTAESDPVYFPSMVIP